MRPPPSRRSARRVLGAAGATLLVAAVLAVAGSGLPPADERSPYASAVVALELARSPADVTAALGPDPAGAARDVVARVVRLDFVFLAVYPLLSLAIVALLSRRRAWRIGAAVLAAAMAAADALENVALLGLLEAPTAARLSSLALWTTVKWGALFSAHALTAGLLLGRDGLTRWLGVVPALAAAVGAAGLLLPAERRLVELAGVSGTAATWAVGLALAIAVLARRR